MDERTSAQDGFDVALLLRVLLGFVMILGTAGCLVSAELRAISFLPADEPLTRAEILAGGRDLILAAVIVAGAPLAALLLAWLRHDRGAVQRWTVAFVAGLVAAGLILNSRHGYLQQCLQASSTKGPGGRTSCDEYTDAGRYAAPAYQTGTPTPVSRDSAEYDTRAPAGSATMRRRHP